MRPFYLAFFDKYEPIGSFEISLLSHTTSIDITHDDLVTLEILKQSQVISNTDAPQRCLFLRINVSLNVSMRDSVGNLLLSASQVKLNYRSRTPCVH